MSISLIQCTSHPHDKYLTFLLPCSHPIDNFDGILSNANSKMCKIKVISKRNIDIEYSLNIVLGGSINLRPNFMKERGLDYFVRSLTYSSGYITNF
ncbi:hypothetical protein D1AOALGA4SA_7827 [Olavius algarvensis Delta 1 endosymbiont]|nr:hypothetical protein D1AOALGA4SA_7827 [Olavius algarvensis Delta 1 endosymbiont]